MKINYDYQIFSQQIYGGISRYFVEIAKGISYSEGKNSVNIISPLYINEYLSESEKLLNIKGIKIPYIQKTSRIIKFINKFLSIGQIRKIKPDILHETYYSYKSIYRGKEKIVLTVYDMIHELFPSYFNKFDHTSKLKKIAVDRADHIICISENTREDLIKILGVKREKTSVIYLGFDLNFKNDFNENISREKIILYVGSRLGYKNFKNLAIAYAKNKEVNKNFKLIAFGGGQFTTSEKKFFKEIGLSNNNIFHVSGDDQKLAYYYKISSLFVYPSLYEGFGIPPLEAMNLKCPVACSESSSISEIVSDAGVYFDPYSVDSISKTIESVLLNDILKKNLIKKGEKRVKDFSWNKCSSETYNLYKKIIA